MDSKITNYRLISRCEIKKRQPPKIPSSEKIIVSTIRRKCQYYLDNNRELFKLAKDHSDTNDLSEKYPEKGSQINKT